MPKPCSLDCARMVPQFEFCPHDHAIAPLNWIMYALEA